MELWRLWVLRGPNVWTAGPVIEAGVDLSAWAGQPRQRSARALERLRAGLPALENIEESANPARVFERLWLHLQILAGNTVRFGDTRPAHRAHCYRVAVEYQQEPVGRACLHAALALCRAAWEGRPYPIAEEISLLRNLAAEQRLEPSTLALVEAARARGIPIDHFNPSDGRYLLLGHGARQRRSLATETDDVSALARSSATDKHLTEQLLRDAGVPVPADAWKTGTEHRVLVVEDRVVAVARIEPPHVVGDGFSSVAKLVEAVNRDPRRGNADPAPLRRLKIDAVALKMLAEQGQTLDTIPPRGARVLLRCHPPHLDHGGWPCDVTEDIHPETAACAVAAAQALRVRVAGIDLVAMDIARPLTEQGGGVIEVNTGPGLELHLAPWNDHPRPVGAAIVASLFPHGCDGRIPIVAVTGGRAQSAGQCLAALLTDAGYRVGRASRDGVFLAGRKINLEVATAYEKARAVLRNPLVDVAVLESDALDLMREGFGCDHCDVVLATDSPEESVAESLRDSEPHSRSECSTSTDGRADVAEAWNAVLHALAPDGKAVFNAEDPPSLDSALPSADRLIWFAETGDNDRLSSHRAAGGAAVFLCGDSLVVARGALEQRLPFGGRPVEREPREQLALLAALAGSMALNLCGDEEPAPSAPGNATLEAALSTV